MKTKTNLSISHLWKAPFSWVCIELASDKDVKEILFNCKIDIQKVQNFMEGINLLDKEARCELASVLNCTTQLQEMIIHCNRRFDKSKSKGDHVPYTTKIGQ